MSSSNRIGDFNAPYALYTANASAILERSNDIALKIKSEEGEAFYVPFYPDCRSYGLNSNTAARPPRGIDW